ncbi:bifunctional [glutamate--ammonia ligase]-adenylyl-L-tyrosine phosphorylase/[glutamate--ammonia-ligase] adenylyltransferase [Arenimonas sp. GDDSR-1]|uniref:bifunctional [glutamate--ammonia ligase]-adenylyl-L-tyrosine phosphorylase/[glutamate--ammonia-ligase] adenylyltransferase n=1 Tax=Arenimonas sp. GDDSR-1 TaxID=2950125 RepID=UPI00262E2DC9|nr:bifunctional [glutamate--ammonia ligase]-adenylyl-L-tyrosine phosphorylase/[glutamate--ammonia-ligase] adenylyltransferase [Arenimonas sp. GDDSR-1]
MSYKALPPVLAALLADHPRNAPPPEALARLAEVSDFAVEVLVQQPGLLAGLDEPLQPLHLPEDVESEWPVRIRRWRRAQSLKLIWRDVCGTDTVEQTLAGSTWIAEQALQAGFAAIDARMRRSHGTVRDGEGVEQHMTVLALGKLGGGELNFSSDVDLVYAFSGHGISDGERPIAAEAYFTRLGQRLANLLDEVTAEGFCHRVDLRLRPFGASGRLLLSFNAMEQYFQSAGRDWERYAWLKARPVAGDAATGWRLLDMLRPFVFRRYLDFTAIDGLREMKAKIEAEVQRRDKHDDLKLGPGGIREIEFYVQALQIIYGGRHPELQVKGLLEGLLRLREAGLIAPDAAESLRSAYVFLRRLENRVQMMADAQVHRLPDAPALQQRLARGLAYPDMPALRVDLERHRATVEQLFAGLLGGPAGPAAESASGSDLPSLGFADAGRHAERLAALFESAAAQALADRSKQRLQRVATALTQACSSARRPDDCLAHAISFLQATLKRSSYIALLDEQPNALRRVVDVFDESPWMAQQLIDYPLLLDELLDSRIIARGFDAQTLPTQIEARLAGHADDAEAALLALNESRLSLAFKIAYHVLFHGMAATEASRLLTQLAEQMLGHCNRIAAAEIRRQHGTVPDSAFAVIGYGSLGASGLSFNSDLDLVFLNRVGPVQASDGARSLDASRYFLRQAQKLIALLDLTTSAGSLYEADIRLRPDGAKGLLVSTLDSFAAYQKQRAWIWELQALVRARAVAGDATLCAAFEGLRAQILCSAREHAHLHAEITAMRHRMRTELDRSRDDRFDLKHGSGGLTDIEFFLQAQVLMHAAACPELVAHRDSIALARALADCGRIGADEAAQLAAAVETLQAVSLRCHLALQPRVVAADAAVRDVRRQVGAILARHGFDFAEPQ